MGFSWQLVSFSHLLTSNVTNNYRGNRNSPLRRRFHPERCGRTACFSRTRKGHSHRRSLYMQAIAFLFGETKGFKLRCHPNFNGVYTQCTPQKPSALCRLQRQQSWRTNVESAAQNLRSSCSTKTEISPPLCVLICMLH
ncbi:hypothetical protein Y032_0316g2280 [Ancylostoma ceylanicum]|uniref:Uncharacterized protein n=1 Tax=Ancylostoma ceylanicum TaxID=53326 RepID=A0A016S2G0_9BILA|nr:hypothetical protein Y032_0316g2280 [Ancylostoma ceylanicum]